MSVRIRKIVARHRMVLFVLSIFILFQIIINAFFPYLTKWIIDDVLLKQQFNELKLILLGTICLILLQVPINISVSYYCAKWTQLVILDLRMDLSQQF